MQISIDLVSLVQFEYIRQFIDVDTIEEYIKILMDKDFERIMENAYGR